MIFISIIILFSFSFSQIIDHQISKEIFNETPFDIKVYSDYKSDEIIKFNVYYKTNSSNIFLQGSLNKISENYYTYTIPPEMINGEYLEYYILLETSNGTYKTIPENDPYDIPISLLVLDEGTFIEEFQNNGLDNDVNIISPQPDQIIAPDDVFIALSYFRMDDINLGKLF